MIGSMRELVCDGGGRWRCGEGESCSAKSVGRSTASFDDHRSPRKLVARRAAASAPQIHTRSAVHCSRYSRRAASPSQARRETLSLRRLQKAAGVGYPFSPTACSSDASREHTAEAWIKCSDVQFTGF